MRRQEEGGTPTWRNGGWNRRSKVLWSTGVRLPLSAGEREKAGLTFLVSMNSPILLGPGYMADKSIGRWDRSKLLGATQWTRRRWALGSAKKGHEHQRRGLRRKGQPRLHARVAGGTREKSMMYPCASHGGPTIWAERAEDSLEWSVGSAGYKASYCC
ncbi:uncharacterized protein LY89DRAFT_662826 [Mollisia scopiformis]|uniref:Uncharacterized protein n=1 Tax=Mollisia scopiformis TaxID=149040 RepID=A0A194XVM4_MOLSC|nr:uncharacterized protein LY89DRAFT_662826 [Mollisia scopiformis]KUJ24054.1 hypothetical protein LY89DRAFT_662826 [Mollisia scopiformis]